MNLDTLKSRDRETAAFADCLEAKRSVVIDNTNATPEHRARYIGPARAAGYRIDGYQMDADVEGCLARNEGRPHPVPAFVVRRTASTMIPLSPEEDFDSITLVAIAPGGGWAKTRVHPVATRLLA